MRIAYAGTPELAATVLTALLKSPYRPEQVFTQPDRPQGRSKQPVPSPVAVAAEQAGIAVAKPEKLTAGDLSGFDVLLVAAYGQILPADALAVPEHGCINVHASLLPAYRGASPIQQAILDGAHTTGVTIMQMDAGMDTGPILASREVPVPADATAESLSFELARAGAELLLKILPDYLAGNLEPTPQPEAGVSETRLLKREDGRIDWAKPAAEIERMVRAFTPWPQAFTEIDGKRLAITKAELTDSDLSPGRFEGPPLTAGTGEGSLALQKVVPAGKAEMVGDDWLRGYRGKSDRFA